MQFRKVILSVVFVVGMACFSFAQFEPLSPSSHRVLGYFNPDTGLFEPFRASGQDVEFPPLAAPTTGTVVFNLTITLKTPLPKNGILACGAGASVIETTFSAAESGFAFAKLVSGNTYSCTVTIPYSWTLNSPSTDKIILSYKAQVTEGIQVTATNGTATVVVAGAGRGSSQTIPSVLVPANGATTTENVSVTL